MADSTARLPAAGRAVGAFQGIITFLPLVAFGEAWIGLPGFFARFA